MRKLFPLLLMILAQVLQTHVQAQQVLRWYTPDHVEGVCTRDSEHIFHRLPAYMEQQVRPIVWQLSLNTAGEYIHFKTTARNLVIQYYLSGKTRATAHMPETGVSGIDLYARDKHGNWNWAPAHYTFGDTCRYTYTNMGMAGDKMADFYLYLPLYNTIQWLTIGCAPADSFTFVPTRKDMPIVAYGTSIMQGAEASRPGMAWTNILERNLDREVINLGFSGNGKFERPIFNLMATVEASLYIFDCMPNLAYGNHTQDQAIKNRIDTGIQVLRAAHPNTPILLVEHADGHIPFSMDTTLANKYHMASLLMKAAYEEIMARGVKDIYLLTEEEINFDINSTAEGTHPNDWGMMKYAQAYEKKIREIVQEPVGTKTTQAPVEQYRDGFDWQERHLQVIDNIKKTNPAFLVFGNSIINNWGGEPVPAKGMGRGEDSWQQYMAPLRVQNAGFGNDRIENVLWRVYHGELDHFNGKGIIVMIGTNNLAMNTDEEIVEGLSFLLQQISTRKPATKIMMVGILPRKGKEQRVALLNEKIKAMALANHFMFVDISAKFLTGKQVNESLFIPDGLHPNQEGYKVLGKALKNQLQVAGF